jgi:hypothetical protein
MHGAGLRRLVEVVGAQGASGRAILESLACDRTVTSLLLLHDLHPHDPPTRIDRALADLRAELGGYAIAVELVDASPECIRVRISSQGASRRPASFELRERVESAIFARAPDIEAVEIEGLPLPDVHELRFVPRSAALQTSLFARPSANSVGNSSASQLVDRSFANTNAT